MKSKRAAIVGVILCCLAIISSSLAHSDEKSPSYTRHIRTEQLELVDSNGKTQAIIRPMQDGWNGFAVYAGSEPKAIFATYTTSDGGVLMKLDSPKGRGTVKIGLLSDSTCEVEISQNAKSPRILLGVGPDGSSNIEVTNKNGKTTKIFP